MRLQSLIVFFMAASIQPALASEPVIQPNPSEGSLIFEIIQDQFVFNETNIKKAALVENRGSYVGLRIELNPSAGYVFERVVKERVGQPIHLVFNKRIISTAIIKAPLGNDFLITGISQADAQLFIHSLNASHAKNKHEDKSSSLAPVTIDPGLAALSSN